MQGAGGRGRDKEVGQEAGGNLPDGALGDPLDELPPAVRGEHQPSLCLNPLGPTGAHLKVQVRCYRFYSNYRYRSGDSGTTETIDTTGTGAIGSSVTTDAIRTSVTSDAL